MISYSLKCIADDTKQYFYHTTTISIANSFIHNESLLEDYRTFWSKAKNKHTYNDWKRAIEPYISTHCKDSFRTRGKRVLSLIKRLIIDNGLGENSFFDHCIESLEIRMAYQLLLKFFQFNDDVKECIESFIHQGNGVSIIELGKQKPCCRSVNSGHKIDLLFMSHQYGQIVEVKRSHNFELKQLGKYHCISNLLGWNKHVKPIIFSFVNADTIAVQLKSKLHFSKSHHVFDLEDFQLIGRNSVLIGSEEPVQIKAV